jgi:hypothetical protein
MAAAYQQTPSPVRSLQQVVAGEEEGEIILLPATIEQSRWNLPSSGHGSDNEEVETRLPRASTPPPKKRTKRNPKRSRWDEGPGGLWMPPLVRTTPLFPMIEDRAKLVARGSLPRESPPPLVFLDNGVPWNTRVAEYRKRMRFRAYHNREEQALV